MTGAIQLYERLASKTLSKRTYFWIFVVTFSFAGFFMAWREQYERAEQAEASLSKKDSAPSQINIPPAQVVIMPGATPASRPTAATDKQRSLPLNEINDMADVLPRGEGHCIVIVAPSVASEADRNERQQYAEPLSKPFRKALWSILTNMPTEGARPDWSGVILWTRNPSHPGRTDILKAFDQAPSVKLRKESGLAFDSMSMLGLNFPSEEVRKSLSSESRTACPYLYVGSR